ncbi:MAG: SLBB domain-containing protein [Ignavibacteriales bacterium]|nr:MAG: SLBB domain-containing protein [Ignavibacteriales bacterium]
MLNRPILLIVMMFLISVTISAQEDKSRKDVQIGLGTSDVARQYPGSYYDFSDAETVNIKVAIWGNVRNAGRYVIPVYTTMIDLISLAGGPNEMADMDDLRLYRSPQSGEPQLIKFRYDDLLDADYLIKNRNVPKLEPGDVLLVPGGPKMYFRDWFSLTLSIVSMILSVVVLVVGLNRTN